MTALWEYYVPTVIVRALVIMYGISSATTIDDITSFIKLFKFSRQRDCLDECVTPLVITIYDMVAYGNSRTHFADLCIEYSSALACFERNAERCKADLELFKVLTSGLNVACDAQRSLFDSAFACVDLFRDRPLSECEKSCRLYAGLRNWTSSQYMKTLSGGGEALLLSLRDAGPFCSGLSCYLSCSQTHLNYMCGEEGERILELFTHPLHQLGRRYSTAPAEIKTLMQSIAIPHECAQIAHTDNEDQLIFGKGILRDVDVDDFYGEVLYAEGKNKKEKDPDYFDLSLVHIRKGDLDANGLVATDESVAYVVFSIIFAVLVSLAILVAIAITVLWCRTTTGKAKRKIHHTLRFVTAVSPSVRIGSTKSPARPLMGTKEN